MGVYRRSIVIVVIREGLSLEKDCHRSRIVIGAGLSLEHDCRRRHHQMNIQYIIAYFVKEQHRKRSSDWRGAMERVVGVVFIVIGSR